LVTKAKMLGMETELISAGRKINDGMGAFIASQVDRTVSQKGKILVLGLTFKENIPDTRNSKVFDVIKVLEKKGHVVSAHDPWHDRSAIQAMGVTPGSVDDGPFDAVILAVPHREYEKISVQEFTSMLKPKGLLYDLKSLHDASALERVGLTYISL
jgi:UDP-N-acetyl-D-glucosamine/UDP-N-acetyl-D-galactosamine dehydrogenase